MQSLGSDGKAFTREALMGINLVLVGQNSASFLSSPAAHLSLNWVQSGVVGFSAFLVVSLVMLLLLHMTASAFVPIAVTISVLAVAGFLVLQRRRNNLFEARGVFLVGQLNTANGHWETKTTMHNGQQRISKE